MKKQSLLFRFALPGWLFVMANVLYHELALHFWLDQPFLLGRFLAVAAFGLGLGCLLGFLSSLLPSARAQKWASVIVSVLVCALWLTEFFLREAFGKFMIPTTILGGAGGVATDFADEVMATIGGNLWRIGLMLLPTILYGLLCRPVAANWKLRGALAGAGAAMYLLGFAAVYTLTPDSAKLGKTYEFDSAAGSFGLHMALVLEVGQGGSGNAEPQFVPAPTQTPTQPAAPAEQPQQATEPAPEYGDNVLPLDFGALAQDCQDASFEKVCQYVDSLTPSKRNAYTGLFAGKNLILITAEAFTKPVIDPERTPTLYRMATQGIQFTDYYQPAWGASTTSGEFSNLVGIVPTNGGSCMKEAIQQDLFLTMGHQLQKQGYYSTAYHNHNHDFYDRNKTHTHLGYDRFLAQYGGLEGITPVWPESDTEMMDITVPQYIDHQPFSIYYMTVSGHSRYSKTENAMTRKHYDKVADLPYSEAVKCYHACQLELEEAMASLLRQLEEAGIADDTVIVLATDHYPYGLEPSSTWKNKVNYLPELYGVEQCDRLSRDGNALIIWSGCLEGKNIVVDEPVYSLDILPTLSNLFGLPYDSRLLVGRDVFSDTPALVLWPDFSWKTEQGFYDALAGTFTPAPGAQADERYQKAITDQVINKITYSRWVLDKDFFGFLSPYLSAENAPE